MRGVSFFFNLFYHIQPSTERERLFLLPLFRCPDAGVWLGTCPGHGAGYPVVLPVACFPLQRSLGEASLAGVVRHGTRG